MSSVKIMVSSHLVESVQQARKERFMLQDSVEKYDSFVFPDSLKCVKPQQDSVIDTDLPLRFLCSVWLCFSHLQAL